MVQVYENLLDKIGFFTRNLFNEIETNHGKALISGIKCDDYKKENDIFKLLPESTYIILTFPESRVISLTISKLKVVMNIKGIYQLEFVY